MNHLERNCEGLDAAVFSSDMMPAPVQFKCTVVDDQNPKGIPLEQWGDPPAAQRQWVGLTDEEAQKCRRGTWQATFRAIEAKLKEKNNG